MTRVLPVAAVVVGLAGVAAVPAQADDADALAKELSNPVASLISVPLQNNFDFGGGPEDEGFIYTLNIQPVIPIALSDSWNLITRTILPVTYRSDFAPDSLSGIGDITQSFFFSPAPSPNGFVWAVGPVFLWPSASEAALGGGKLGAGVTVLALQQTGPWTVGMLANHIWSVAGPRGRADISATFLQPFVAYALGQGTTLSLNTESTYDWERGEWTIPVNLSVSKVFAIGDQRVSAAFGGRYYADKPLGGPDWGLRFTFTLLFPG